VPFAAQDWPLGSQPPTPQGPNTASTYLLLSAFFFLVDQLLPQYAIIAALLFTTTKMDRQTSLAASTSRHGQTPRGSASQPHQAHVSVNSRPPTDSSPRLTRNSTASAVGKKPMSKEKLDAKKKTTPKLDVPDAKATGKLKDDQVRGRLLPWNHA
jgi:hypothetical protein